MKRAFLPLLFCVAACGPIYNEPTSTYETETVSGMDRNHGLLRDIPECDEKRLWDNVRAKFNGTEGEYRNTGIFMDDLLEARQAGAHVKLNGKVARGWCEARMNFSDNLVRRVKVEIGSGLGFAGTSYSLSICVEGLDPHKANAPSCRALRWREF